jgi:LuxR family maltose regulon positive regulatory protein
LRQPQWLRTSEMSITELSVEAHSSSPLSKRELEVLQLIAQGNSNQQIADVLFISLHTVKTHARRINGKLGVERRTQAVAKAKLLGVCS